MKQPSVTNENSGNIDYRGMILRLSGKRAASRILGTNLSFEVTDSLRSPVHLQLSRQHTSVVLPVARQRNEGVTACSLTYVDASTATRSASDVLLHTVLAVYFEGTAISADPTGFS